MNILVQEEYFFLFKKAQDLQVQRTQKRVPDGKKNETNYHYGMERKYLLILDLNLVRSYVSGKTSEERSFQRTEVEEYI